jgi:hypothetical protein
MAEKELLSIEEFMDKYSQTRTSTYGQIKKGKLLSRKIGSRTFIRTTDAEMWMNALENKEVIPAPVPLSAF